MSDVQKRIADLLAQRAGIDAELAKVQAEAVKELETAKANVAALEAVLKPVPIKPESPRSQVQPIDETDAGRGVREVDDNTSAASFKEELASLRERTREKRSRLQ